MRIQGLTPNERANPNELKQKVSAGTICSIRATDSYFKHSVDFQSENLKNYREYHFVYNDGTHKTIKKRDEFYYVNKVRQDFGYLPNMSNLKEVYTMGNRTRGFGEMMGGIHISLFDYGFVTVSPDSHINMGNFKIALHARGKGLSRRLFRQAKRMLRIMGCTTMRFKCDPALVKFYEKLGARVALELHDSYKMECPTAETYFTTHKGKLNEL